MPANLVNSNVVRAVRRRGYPNNGANDGLCYFNANYAPSNAEWNYGGELLPFTMTDTTLAKTVPDDNRDYNSTLHILFHGSFGNRNNPTWNGLVRH